MEMKSERVGEQLQSESRSLPAAHRISRSAKRLSRFCAGNQRTHRSAQMVVRLGVIRAHNRQKSSQIGKNLRNTGDFGRSHPPDSIRFLLQGVSQ